MRILYTENVTQSYMFDAKPEDLDEDGDINEDGRERLYEEIKHMGWDDTTTHEVSEEAQDT